MRFLYFLVLFFSLETQAQPLVEQHISPQFSRHSKTLIVCHTIPKSGRVKYRFEIKSSRQPFFRNRKDVLSVDIHRQPSQYSHFLTRIYLEHTSIDEKLEHFYGEDFSLIIQLPELDRSGSPTNLTTPAKIKAHLADGTKFNGDLVCDWKDTDFVHE